ncbi:hypothetical protein V8C42DRAFT_291221 [Trichoderma barbatum]
MNDQRVKTTSRATISTFKYLFPIPASRRCDWRQIVEQALKTLRGASNLSSHFTFKPSSQFQLSTHSGDASSSHPRISSQLPVGQNFETSGTNRSERKARAEEHSIHSDEGCTDLHTEWEMRFEYAAFEGYGIEDVQSETELDSTDSHEDQPWWICLIPHFLR